MGISLLGVRMNTLANLEKKIVPTLAYKVI